MSLGVHHPALAVPDMHRARGFYCGVPGFRVVMEAEIPPGIAPRASGFLAAFLARSDWRRYGKSPPGPP